MTGTHSSRLAWTRKLAVAFVAICALALLASSAGAARLITRSYVGAAACNDAPQGETTRIQAHLSRVESALRARAVDDLSPVLRAERHRNLDRLHDYWTRGRFPHNHDFPTARVPYFVDEHGTACAVADLIIASGHAGLAKRVAATTNNALLPEMTNSAELVAWANGSGLTLDELAWIQPTYGPCWGVGKACPAHCADVEPHLIRWNGDTFEKLGTLPEEWLTSSEPFIETISVADESTIWGVGRRAGLWKWTGSSWEQIKAAPANLTGVWGTRNEAYVAGNRFGRIKKTVLGGWEWTELNGDSNSNSVAVWGTGQDVWFIGNTGLLHVVRDAVTHVPVDLAFPYLLRSVSGSSPRDVWIAGFSAPAQQTPLMHWDGARLVRVANVPDPNRETEIGSVWARASDDAWGIGKTLWRWNGTAWSRAPSPKVDDRDDEVRSIWGSGPNDVWAVGSRVHRWNGKEWKTVDVGSAAIASVTGLASDRVWFLPKRPKHCQKWVQDATCLAESPKELQNCNKGAALNDPIARQSVAEGRTQFDWRRSLYGAIGVAGVVLAMVAVVRRRKHER